MKTSRLLIPLAMLSLTACRVQVTIMSTSVPTPTPTVVAAVRTDTPTAVGESPSPTSVLPTATEVWQPMPTVPPIPTWYEMAKVFLIALEDNGRAGPLVGCGDSLVPINVAVPRGPNFVEVAMGELFKNVKYYGASGLYNALYQSDLRVVEITSESGKIIVRLAGTIMLGGTCDAPRVKAQIEQTALQFSPDSDIAVFVNDVPLEEVLSQK